MMTAAPKGPRTGKRIGRPRRPLQALMQAGYADSAGAERAWVDVPRMFRVQRSGALPSPWQEIFAPLRRGATDDLVVVGQFGQSIDARVATTSGHSHYINRGAGLAHLH